MDNGIFCGSIECETYSFSFWKLKWTTKKLKRNRPKKGQHKTWQTKIGKEKESDQWRRPYPIENCKVEHRNNAQLGESMVGKVI